MPSYPAVVIMRLSNKHPAFNAHVDAKISTKKKRKQTYIKFLAQSSKYLLNVWLFIT